MPLRSRANWRRRKKAQLEWLFEAGGKKCPPASAPLGGVNLPLGPTNRTPLFLRLLRTPSSSPKAHKCRREAARRRRDSARCNRRPERAEQGRLWLAFGRRSRTDDCCRAAACLSRAVLCGWLGAAGLVASWSLALFSFSFSFCFVISFWHSQVGASEARAVFTSRRAAQTRPP